MELPAIPAYIRYTSMVFCITIMIFGVIGNVMVPFVLFRTKDMRNSTNIFLTNLSVADLLVLLVCTPTVLVEINSKPETWVLGHELCKVVPFIELTVAHASVLTILAISFERYYAICEPLKAGYICTKTRAMLICLATWTIASFFTSPILIMAEYSKEQYIDGTNVTVCMTQATDPWAITFFLMTISVFFLIPLLILVIIYSIIAKHLILKTTGNGHTTCTSKMRKQAEHNLKARRQVVLMLGAVVVSFFLCLMPFRILTLCIIIVPDDIFRNFGIESYYNVLFFCRIMLYLNSAINPILYNLMSSKFRKGFQKLYCCECWTQRSGFSGFGVRGGRGIGGRGRLLTLTNTTTTTTTSSFVAYSVNRKIRNNNNHHQHHHQNNLQQNHRSMEDLQIGEN